MDALRDRSGRIEDFTWRYLNPAAARLIGRPVEELIDHRVTEYIPKAWEQPGLLERYTDVLATGKTVEFDQYAGASGSKRWFRIIASPANRGVAVWFADISELKRTEGRRRRSELHLIEAPRLSHCASWAFDPGSGRVVWSPEHYVIFGVDPGKKELSIEDAAAPIHPEDIARCTERLSGAVRDAHEFDEHFRIVWPNGEIRYIHSVARPRFDEHGRLIELIGTAIDTTEQMRAAQALRAIQTELARASRIMTLGELMSAIAHEVNQPLVAVVSNAGAALRWLGQMPEGLGEARLALLRIVDDGHRAGNVITSIRALARRDGTHKILVDINQLIHEVASLLQFDLRDASITLRTELDENLPPVPANRVQLEHTLLNLLRNAVEATAGQPRREIVVHTSANGDCARIRIEDSGVGLAPQMLSRIFEPFHTTKPEGMGIGLAMSRTVIEAHQGRIWAECNESGSGATFQCELPLRDTDPTATTRHEAADH